MYKSENAINARYKPILPRLRITNQQRQNINSPRKSKFIQDERKLESIVEQRNFQKQLIELVIPLQDEAQHTIIQQEFTSKDILKHYKQLPSKPTLLYEKALKGIHPLEQIEYRNKELKKLDKKVQLLNERTPLQESWKSPFLSQPQLYKSQHPIDLNASQEIQINEQGAILLNENFKGFGQRLRSYLDYDKQNLLQKIKNPKCLLREHQIRILKNKNTRELDLVKEWNILLKQDKLVKHVEFPKAETRFQQFGTISSISHYYSIQDFHKKKVVGQNNTQQTPSSQISPQFIVKNSRQSNNQSEPIDFGKSNQILDISEIEKGQEDVCIHRDTFLTYCEIFWEFIRKEDEIVERVIWAFCKGDQFTFSSFKYFYKLIIFQEGTVDEYIKFTYDFFMGQERNEIPFAEIQGLLRLLTCKIDNKGDSLSNQILMDIVNEIHRPQIIKKEVLQQLIFEDKLPPTLVVKMIYEQA